MGCMGGDDKRPFYPDGSRGRPVRGIETMLRMYLLQVWFTLSDEGVEDAICDSVAMRMFVGMDFMAEEAPDATALLKFSHMLEEYKIGEKMFAEVRERLDRAGLMMQGGTIVDATVINGPVVHEERDGQEGPGDAPGQEGQRVALRHEGACRSGCRHGVRAHDNRHGGQRA